MAMSCDEREYWQEVAYDFRYSGPPCPGDDLDLCDCDDEVDGHAPAPCALDPELARGFRWVR